jgi:hypothetical protein
MNAFIEIPASKISLSKRKTVYGIGINDACYIVSTKIDGKQKFCPYYNVWKGMIQRCYDKITHSKNPAYKNCSVSLDWHLFSNFKDWMVSQDWQGKQLDKDILNIGNKIYSIDNCIFVSSSVNTLLMDCLSSRGQYPQGVGLHTSTGKYRAKCRVNGFQKSLGLFFTISEAEIAYLQFKSALVESIATGQSKKIKQGLIRHVAIMRDRIALIS